MADPIYTPTVKTILIDSNSSIEDLITGSASYGTIINKIIVQANQTVTAGIIKFYISTDNGSTWRLLREVPVFEVIATDVLPGFSAVLSFDGLSLASAVKLGVKPTMNESFSITVFGLDISY